MKLKVSAAILALLASSTAFGQETYSSERSNAATGPTDRLHLSPSLSAGVGPDFLGAKLDLRNEQIARFVSKSVLFHVLSVGGGARYYLQPDGHGFFFALHPAISIADSSFRQTQRNYCLALGSDYSELGGGPALSYFNEYVQHDEHPSNPVPRRARSIGAGVFGSSASHGPLLPDAQLAIGIEF